MTSRRAQGLEDWQQFIVDYGWRARLDELAAVLGRTKLEVDRVKNFGACVKFPKAKEFAELFTLWNGRAPLDEEWPLPRKLKARGAYEWQGPELALLASLIGRLGTDEIAQVLTERLKKITGDPEAFRDRLDVTVRSNQIGLVSADVIGGITIQEAGREINSVGTVQNQIRQKKLVANKVGRLWVIPHEAWAKWKANRLPHPPEGYVQLSTLREALGFKGDKLAEYATMGLIATAIRCTPLGGQARTTQHGAWFVSPEVAAQLVADRRAGLPMPWIGKTDPRYQKISYALWQERKHPHECETCRAIWGEPGAPSNFDEYLVRYTPLSKGAKLHLTKPYSPGMTVTEVAGYCDVPVSLVREAIAAGTLTATSFHYQPRVSRSAATHWKVRGCPKGVGESSWQAIVGAASQHLFSVGQLERFIEEGKLASRLGTDADGQIVRLVSRHQSRVLRDEIGFTEEQAAGRIGVTIVELRSALKGINWRGNTGITLSTLAAVRRRLQHISGYSIAEAAELLDTSVEWIEERRNDGTIAVAAGKCAGHDVYITEKMMAKLRQALVAPAALERLGEEWLHLSEAAEEAGVTTSSIQNWARDGSLAWRDSETGRRFHRNDVRARATAYWQTCKWSRRRAQTPQWFCGEGANPVFAATG